ncbi:Bug family tripartite tricarboxylate transporter substrate binding protein [Hydrogenophaga sp. SL48]|jgi:tripartite-type tricarboxylate transporter receptor subunit TctC|uniref:Bug family tripartite tricarboxylate transporter substrate binding protein n=1 Tax=Hydrogenophaga sp. SL48 TaxID=2806347 RepID=UPI001F28BAEB|nr:tripartite tricarboxylate transporter substrate binding protein [Hydrogenophaga sp. SL48]UJW82731.1 tripartite tricarboxylate transporter substrate binding protein [Hydrogenophaga sp. SL48]
MSKPTRPSATIAPTRTGSRTRRQALALLGATALLGTSLPTWAQDFPQKGRSIRIVVGFTAGGGTDAQARAVAQKLGEVLDANVIVDNRPGASTMLSASEVARAAPDGYTLMYAPSSTLTQNPHTFAKVPYDPFKDFTPITVGGRGPLVLSMSTTVPANNVRELVAHIKTLPGQTSYASFGLGTSSHIYGEAFTRQTQIDSVHVPYKGGSDAAKDLIGGRIQYMFDSAPSAIIASQTGKVKILAIAAPQRISALPDVPTFAEQGYSGLDLPSWLGFYGPANMPPAVLKRLNDALVKVLAMPEIVKFYRDGGYEAGGNSPQAFATLTQVTYDQWGGMIRNLGLPKQ